MFVYVFAIVLIYLALLCVGLVAIGTAMTWVMQLITEKVEAMRKARR